jgi:hypothetical protein
MESESNDIQSRRLVELENLSQTLEQEIEQLVSSEKTEMDRLKKERDFYFQKLRAIEKVC